MTSKMRSRLRILALISLWLNPHVCASEESDVALMRIANGILESVDSLGAEDGFRLTCSEDLGIVCGFWFQVSGEKGDVVEVSPDKPAFYFLVMKSRMGDQAGQIDEGQRQVCDVFEASGLRLCYYSLAAPDWKKHPPAAALHEKIRTELKRQAAQPDGP